MLMHSDRMSNPLDGVTIAHKELTSKRKKTEADHREIAKSEWKGSLYWSKATGIYFPSQNVVSSFRAGAKLNRLGTAFGRAVVCLDERISFDCDMPKDLDDAWESGDFTDCRSVVVQRARLMRYRPRFDRWSMVISLVYAEDVINRADIINSAANAGRLVGIGDFRPEKGGAFGRYSVEEV